MRTLWLLLLFAFCSPAVAQTAADYRGSADAARYAAFDAYTAMESSNGPDVFWWEAGDAHYETACSYYRQGAFWVAEAYFGFASDRWRRAQ